MTISVLFEEEEGSERDKSHTVIDVLVVHPDEEFQKQGTWCQKYILSHPELRKRKACGIILGIKKRIGLEDIRSPSSSQVRIYAISCHSVSDTTGGGKPTRWVNTKSMLLSLQAHLFPYCSSRKLE